MDNQVQETAVDTFIFSFIIKPRDTFNDRLQRYTWNFN
jgi:hypothetical protein